VFLLASAAPAHRRTYHRHTVLAREQLKRHVESDDVSTLQRGHEVLSVSDHVLTHALLHFQAADRDKEFLG
jgi:hypothetical protein